MCDLKSRTIYDRRQLYMGMGNNHGIVFTRAELLDPFWKGIVVALPYEICKTKVQQRLAGNTVR